MNLLDLLKNIKNVTEGNDMVQEDNLTYENMIATILMKLTALEKTLIEKGVIDISEYKKNMDIVVEELKSNLKDKLK